MADPSREDVVNAIRTKYNKTQEDEKTDMEILKQWLATQKHLPEIPSDKMIQSFLHLNKFSIEKTKRKLDMYYSIRTLVPAMFRDKHPLLEHMQRISDIGWFAPLPRLTDDFVRVLMFKLTGEPEDFNAEDFFANTLNVAEIRLREELSQDDVIVYDLKNFKTGHLTRITPMTIKHIATVFEKVYSSRVAAIYLLNCSSFVDTILNMVKPLLKEKLRNRIHVALTVKSLHEKIPKNVLPKDYGGDFPQTLEEIKDSWKQKFVENKELFDKLETLQVDEKLRPEPLRNDEILGFYGNFKQLRVD